MPKIAIIGTGLIGGSLGLAIKKAGVKAEIVGTSRNHGNANHARKMGAIDRAVRTPEEAVEAADLVIVATPPTSVRATLQAIAPHLMEDCIVTDVTSTKAQVLAWAEEILPENVHFVGGHPMAGRETASIKAADATLLQGCTYIIAPGRNASGEAVKAVVDLVVAIGCKPRFVDPVEHDSFVAGISHLPFMLSTALVNATTKNDAWREMSPLAASGYRDISRLASGDPAMHYGICATNAESIARWIDIYCAELQELRQVIANGCEGLEEVFVQAKVARDRWLVKPETDEELPAPEIESSADQMSAILFGHFKLPQFKRAAPEEGQSKGKG
jgi:prephenate dehydrogenase